MPSKASAKAAQTGYAGALEAETLKNTDFRRVLFTGKHAQLVLMCLAPGEEIDKEMHANVDQFFRIESGTATFIFNDTEEHVVKNGDGVVVPAGTYHRVLNASATAPLKLYSIYSPPNHPPGTIHATKAQAEAAEALQGHRPDLVTSHRLDRGSPGQFRRKVR